MAGEIISAEEARRLREAATPGPWIRDRLDVCVVPHRIGLEGWNIADCGRPDSPDCAPCNADLIAAAPDLARTVEHLHAELTAERDAVLAFLLGMAHTAETPQARGLIATIRRAIELRYHRDPLRTPRADGEVSDG